MGTRQLALSPEQLTAITAPGNVVVRAGAGSGKTEVLAHRFVAHIAGELAPRPLMPAEIAAITFTEKATFDMRERIAVVLEERLEREPAGAPRDHLSRARRTLALARISTIHAFCAGILRENCLEANLDPGFQVIDEYETATFLEHICEQALVDAMRARQPGALRLMAIRHRLHASGHGEGAVAALVRIISELSRLGHEPGWIVTKAQEYARKSETESGAVGKLAGELVELIDQLVDLKQGRGATEPLRIHWSGLRPRVLEFNQGSEPQALDTFRELIEYMPDARGTRGDLVRRIRALLNSDNRRLGLDGALIKAYGAARALTPILELAEFVSHTAARVEQARREQGIVTFNDLLTLAYRLLRDNAAVAARYRSSIGALLVDEYQDTDPIQHDIIMTLARPEAGPAPLLFVVGDEKQSIYGFRGADVAVFDRAMREVRQTVSLRKNRRSTHFIIGFVNALSAHVMRGQESTSESFWVRWGDEHVLEPARTPNDDAAIEILLAAEDGNAAAKRAAEARGVAGRINQLIAEPAFVVERDGTRRQARYADIAILMRAFTDVALYEDALRAARIPFYTVKGRGFFACKEILDISALLNALENPRDSLALAAMLRSPLFAISDQCLLEIALQLHERRQKTPPAGPTSLAGLFADEQEDFGWLREQREDIRRAALILRKLRGLCGREPLVTVLRRALELTDYEAVLLGLDNGVQRAANLRKLVEMARGFGARGCFTFGEFVTHLRNLTENPPYEAQAQTLGERENVVRLMTIHQAKGLEFPIVIVPDLGRGAGQGANGSPLLSPEDGLLACDVVGSSHDEIPSAAMHDFRQHLRQREKAESARILYVALTRARDRLILSEGSATGNNGWSEQLRDFLAQHQIEVKSFVEGGEQLMRAVVAGVPIELRKLSACEKTNDVISPEATFPVEPGLAETARRRLGFSATVVPEIVISPTALADFEQCPRLYLTRHVLQLPEPPGGEDQEASSAAMGTVAHAVLEIFKPPPDRVPGENLEQLVTRLGAPAGLTSAQCAAMARELAGYLSETAAPNLTEAIVGRELPFFLNIHDDSLDLFIRGQMDVLLRDGHKLLVRDYKYTRSGRARTYQVQMECYALAAAQAYPNHEVGAEVVFLRDGKTIRLQLPGVDEIRTKLLALGHELIAARRDGEFPKKPSGAAECRTLRCAFVASCWPVSGHTGRGPSSDTPHPTEQVDSRAAPVKRNQC